MPDMMMEVSTVSAQDALLRILQQFDAISTRSLEAIARGAPAGYITRPLAQALIDGRRVVGVAP